MRVVVLRYSLAGLYVVSYLVYVLYPTAHVTEHLRRAVFVSYISLLYSAYYFLNPTTESFCNAVALNLCALGAFAVIYRGMPEYKRTLTQKLLLLLPLLLGACMRKRREWRWWQTSLTVLVLALELIFRKIIYS